VPCASAEVAEAAKLWENAYRLVNAALANELAELCGALALDAGAVLAAAATKPFGFAPFAPGAGAGGPCIPAAAAWLAAAAAPPGVELPLVEAAARRNAERPREVAAEVERELGARGRALAGARVLVLGASYKRGVADVRGSAAAALLSLLSARGAIVAYGDPLVPELDLGHARLRSCRPDASSPERWDAVVLTRDPKGFGGVLPRRSRAAPARAQEPEAPVLIDARRPRRARARAPGSIAAA
jgi:nucleotide sugar dehydrogenase